jgi:GDPmannose 4,6-dehydratase
MNPTRVALITGVTSQERAYPADRRLDKGSVVHGIRRRASLLDNYRIDHLHQDPRVEHRRFELHRGDLTDSTNLIHIILQVQPDAIYNLTAASHVAVSHHLAEAVPPAVGEGREP